VNKERKKGFEISEAREISDVETSFALLYKRSKPKKDDLT